MFSQVIWNKADARSQKQEKCAQGRGRGGKKPQGLGGDGGGGRQCGGGAEVVLRSCRGRAEVLMLAALHQNDMILSDVRSKENFERPPFLICFLKVKFVNLVKK